MSELTSESIAVDDALSAMEYAWDQGWTDGLPIVPPTPALVRRFLDYAELDPGEVVGVYQVRNRAVTAEKVAINAVMAGCKPEYMPVVTAAIEAVTDPEFHLNHIASTSSPWPAFMVNGPIAREIGLNNGMYVLGPGNRANATIGRAVSLTLANCLDARVGGVQQGTMGNPCRMGGMVVAEIEDTPWEPLSSLAGFEPGVNAITAFGAMEPPVDIRVYGMPHVTTAEGLSSVLAEYLGEGYFAPGPHMILVSPSWQRPYLEEGWTKHDLVRYLEENAKTTVARLKKIGRWSLYMAQQADPKTAEQALSGEQFNSLNRSNKNGVPIIDPGDDQRFVYHARSSRKTEYLIGVAGGDVGAFAVIIKPYPIGPNLVIKPIKRPAGAKTS